MPDIDPQIGLRISGAARALAIARSQLEREKDFERRKPLQENFDRAEREMIEASMLVNRGISRPDPNA